MSINRSRQQKARLVSQEKKELDLPAMEDPVPKSKRRQRIEKKLEDSEKQEQHCKGQVGGIVPQVRSNTSVLLLHCIWYDL